MITPEVLFAFGLTVFAWLATWVGSALAFFTKKTNTRFLSVALWFSAGVMIYISLVEILFKARVSLSEIYGTIPWGRYTLAWFFGGIALIALIDTLVPHVLNPHEPHSVEELHTHDHHEHMKQKKLLRMWMITALAIAIHNFPEWLATFVGALHDPQLGVAIAVAIAIHNIPEGIAASIPIYYATWSRRKAFWWSFLSWLAEPVGVIIWYFLLYSWMWPATMGFTFAFVAGIMVYISLDELLPTEREYGEHHLSIYGLIAGMAVMAVSLQLFVI